jgi:Na+-driven multidrug efflux pump
MFVLFRTINFSVTKDFRKNIPKYIKNLLKVGIPSAAENFSYTVSQTVIVGLIATLGTTSITTRIYTFNIAMFIFLLSIAVGNGNQIITGYFVGEKDFDGAYKNTLKVNFMTMLLSTGFALIIALLGPFLIRLLTDDPEIIRVALILLWIEVILEPGRTINLIVIQSLRAAGDTIFPVVMAIISMWGIAVFGSYLSITFGLGLIGVWIAYTADEWFRGISMLLRWKSKVWQSKSFVTEE